MSTLGFAISISISNHGIEKSIAMANHIGSFTINILFCLIIERFPHNAVTRMKLPDDEHVYSNPNEVLWYNIECRSECYIDKMVCMKQASICGMAE